MLVVTPLLHLLLASAHIPALYNENGRDGALAQRLLYELEQAKALPLFVPLPHGLPLANLCRELLGQSPALLFGRRIVSRKRKSRC